MFGAAVPERFLPGLSRELSVRRDRIAKEIPSEEDIARRELFDDCDTMVDMDRRADDPSKSKSKRKQLGEAVVATRSDHRRENSKGGPWRPPVLDLPCCSSSAVSVCSCRCGADAT